MKKQTAVEWLVNEFSNYYAIHQLEDEINQALQIEKEQIINAVRTGHQFCEDGFVPWMGEQYYKQTYQTDLPPVEKQTETCLSCGYSITVDTQEPYNINRTPNIGESCDMR